jgi:hypothetical protein
MALGHNFRKWAKHVVQKVINKTDALNCIVNSKPLKTLKALKFNPIIPKQVNYAGA